MPVVSFDVSSSSGSLSMFKFAAKSTRRDQRMAF